MKLKPYKDLVALSKEKLDEAMVPIRVRSLKAKADMKIAELDSELLTKEQRVHELCAQKDVNLESVADLLDDIDLLERRKEQLTEIVAQLFPEEK
jgi:hypothetical protein